MWYFNSEIIRTPRTITTGTGNDAITHPKSIFRNNTTLVSLGIKPYREDVPDTRYQTFGSISFDTSGDTVVGTVAGVDKSVAELKKAMLVKVNNQVASKQNAIDWYWARASKGGTAVPSDIATYASTIYSEQAAKESAINAMTTIDEIKAYENKPHTETRKTATYNEDGSFKEFNGTYTIARKIDMCTHFTANPTDEVDEAFVSLVAD